MPRGLLIGGLVAAAVLTVGAIALAKDDEAAPPAPTPPAPPTGGGGAKPMTIAEKAFAVRNHALFWSWQAADKACRSMNAEADPQGTVETCGTAMALWKEMMRDVGVKPSEEEAVYNQIAGG